MIASTTARAEFERRSARADLLAANTSAAREPLLFASVLCGVQGSIAAALESEHETEPFRGRIAGDVQRLVTKLEPLLRTAAERGPEQLAEQAQARLSDDPQTAATRLSVYWSGDISAREDYLSRAFLRPYAEVLRARGVTPDRVHNRGCCPFCGGLPIMSTRRSQPESEAGLRMLHCSLCGLEWNFNRICCPSCFEEHPDRLPLYRGDAYPAVRIEACETCRRYVKSIDLTQDARPIAEIDDLLSLAMDLWAADEGFTRIEPGLAGV